MNNQPRRTLKRLEERVNLVWFLSLDKEEQERVFKSCIDKPKLKGMKEVMLKLVEKYDEEKITLNFYPCPHCQGFHLTRADKHRRSLIRRMITKWKWQNDMPTRRSRKILEQIQHEA